MKKKKKIKTKIGMLRFVQDKAIKYGSYVLNNRAVPDYRDGLKPVQRHIVWAAHKLNLTGNKFVKASKLVGMVTGNYHPHGDMAVNDALTGLAQKRTRHNLIEGQGNWGGYNSEAGAPRYIECRLSDLAQKIMLDNNYMAAIPTFPSYDGSEQVPECLPSLLPYLLFKGTQGIAYGTTVGVPPFEAKGIFELTKLALAGKKIDSKVCRTYLLPDFLYGGKPINSRREMREIFKTGKGRLKFTVERKVDNTSYTITGIGLYLLDFEAAVDRLMGLGEKYKGKGWPEIKSAEDNSLDGNIRYVVTFKKGTHIKPLIPKLDNLFSNGLNVALNVVDRQVKDKTDDELVSKFYNLNFPKYMEMWAKWRVKLEIDMLTILIASFKKKLHHQDLLLLVAKHADKVVRVIRDKKHKSREDIHKALAKLLKVSVEDGETILQLALGRLSNLDQAAILAAKKKLEVELKAAQLRLKNPSKSALNVTIDLQKQLLGEK